MTLTQKTALCAAALLGAIAATPASATTFTFTSVLNGGFDQGLLTGTFDLAGPLNAIWTGPATKLQITAFPTGIQLPEGMTVTTWAQQITNSFTLNFGTISTYDFMALTAAGSNPSLATGLCLNNVHANLQGGGRGCAQGSVEIGQKSINYGFRTDTPLVTFAQAVPEPATWAAMLLGLGLIGVRLGSRRPGAEG